MRQGGMNILLGHERGSGAPVSLPLDALRRHLHLIGYSGAGKTTALLTLLTGLLPCPVRRQCVVIIDRLGGFSLDLLRWFSSGFCPGWVRRRLVYIEPAREGVVVPMNPLLYSTPGEGYYRTARAVEIVLRGWASQDISAMPRLARWLFNSFWGAAQLGLTIGDCVHFLRPHSPIHRQLIEALPESLRWEWDQILRAHGSQAETQLESSRNRLTPIFEAPGLRATYSSARNYLDIGRWMDEGRVVLINLAPMGTVPETMADMIGGMVVNEVFSVARSRPPERRVETWLYLDEFQRFIAGDDLEYNLAESRQLLTRLALSHQSFSQLKNDQTDLTSLIFQAQNRLILNVQGEDARILSEEIAGFTYDPRRVKEELWHTTQRISGHRIIELHSRSSSEALARQWNESHGRGRTAHQSTSRREFQIERVHGEGGATSEQESRARGETQTAGTTTGTHETLVPIYEEYEQLASRTYFTFDEQRQEWARALRRLHTGEGVLRVVDDDRLREIRVKRTVPGHLAFPWETVLKRMPQVTEAYERLLEENFAQECFVSPAVIERETVERLERVLRPAIEVRGAPAVVLHGDEMVRVEANPFGN